eukprot:1962756-Pleurochrysis_carterae.AAC.1
MCVLFNLGREAGAASAEIHVLLRAASRCCREWAACESEGATFDVLSQRFRAATRLAEKGMCALV